MNRFKYEMAEFLPFRDKAVCERVRAIKREDICKHPNRNFQIKVIEQDDAHTFSYVLDIVSGIQRSVEEGRKSYVIILPATNPYYAWVAEMINRLRILATMSILSIWTSMPMKTVRLRRVIGRAASSITCGRIYSTG